MKRVLLLLLILSIASPIHVAAQTASPAPSPLTADTPEKLSGVTFTAPKDWSEQRTDTMTILSAPENARIIIVHVGAASDAKAAVARAWKLLDPTFDRKVEIAEPSAANHGWDERAEISYVTSPDEHRVIVAEAYRKNTNWTVLLADGSASAFEKRGAAIGVVLASVQPEGYVGETFVGKTANRLTPKRVKELVDFVKTGMAELHVPGVGLALIDHGRIVYEGGLGVRTMGSTAPVGKNTLFMIASNTKGMTTLMLARLVDQGKLRWNEPVTQAFPTFRLGSPTTTAKVRIEDLIICACTGVPRKDYDWLLGATPKDGPERTFTLLAATEPTSKYGELFQYSNTMASAAGYIAGRLEYPNLSLGSAYDTAMQQLVFSPLGMTHTTFDMNKALASDHAGPHDQDVDGTMRVIGQTMNELVIPFRPAGGEWSSAHDMIQYVQNELTDGILPNGKRLVSQANHLQRRMHTVAVGKDEWYGMGLMDDRRYGISVIHHGGDIFGYHSDWVAIPSAQVGAVILTNSGSGADLPGPFLRRLLEVLYDGKPEAATELATTAKNDVTGMRTLRNLLTVPPSHDSSVQLASSYREPSLGDLGVLRKGSGVTFAFARWSSPVATRKNPDGSTSFMTIAPGIFGLEFTPGMKSGKRTLVTRDGQHVYTYVEHP